MIDFTKTIHKHKKLTEHELNQLISHLWQICSDWHFDNGLHLNLHTWTKKVTFCIQTGHLGIL